MFFAGLFSTERVTVQSYVLGSADIGMTPGQDLNHVIPTGSLSPTTTDILLFPGMFFGQMLEETHIFIFFAFTTLCGFFL